jgi:uncharacterized protein with HEPN domain
MIKDDPIYLVHILISISKIQSYSLNVDYNDFMKNEMIQDAIMRQIEIIGEASGRVNANIKNKYTKIPWIDIKGMRNRLIHNYFGVDVEEVWKVIQRDIPELKKQIKQILDEIDPQLSMEYK